ncbi:MAG: hypothetical protein QOH81_3424 [Sphingomonadales bacterium]|nr:hypothetical protein [Sphingomonadales bacterium]
MAAATASGLGRAASGFPSGFYAQGNVGASG